MPTAVDADLFDGLADAVAFVAARGGGEVRVSPEAGWNQRGVDTAQPPSKLGVRLVLLAPRPPDDSPGD